MTTKPTNPEYILQEKCRRAESRYSYMIVLCGILAVVIIYLVMHIVGLQKDIKIIKQSQAQGVKL